MRDFVWPRGGWWRSSRYVAHRVRRLPGSPVAIAVGFACGAFISFTPLFGLHYLLGGALAWLLRGSVIASVFGATLGWLYPIVIVWAYQLGSWVIGTHLYAVSPADAGLHYFMRHPWQALVPTAIGSVPFALAAGVLAFALAYWTVASYRAMRGRRGVRFEARRPVAREEFRK